MDTTTVPRLGLAESIERLDAMPEFLAAAIEAATPADLAVQPGAGEFSLVEHACHLRDVEREGYLVRVRRMLAERQPALEPFDGGAIAAARDYPSQDARRAAHDFAAARHELTRLIAPLTAEQLRLEAAFGDRRVCFADVIAMMVGHDAEHRAEIERLMDFIEE
jgi:hypothetical protein